MSGTFAVRNSEWRSSTHHLIFDAGSVYLDIVKTPEKIVFDTISLDGYGASGEFEGIPVPQEVFDAAFGDDSAEEGVQKELDEATSAKIINAIADIVDSRELDFTLVAQMTEFGLTHPPKVVDDDEAGDEEEARDEGDEEEDEKI
eukprot:INCI14164.1.p1 GENE.INCI14164.1~~INCI14164.1.p1  ORF type:complete len:145 (+),score=35.22 INCI14164.1:73-507(+)